LYLWAFDPQAIFNQQLELFLLEDANQDLGPHRS
jgi:hypothetical protein